MTLEPLTPQRRRAMTRQHLLDAAEVVFTRNGFHGSSLDEVAATAGFTKGAVYSNFKSKDDLFLALLDDREERQAAAVREELAQGPKPRTEALPRVRQLISEGWSGDWAILYLEFVLYAARNPEARRKLAAQARRVHQTVEHMLDREYDRAGTRPPFETSLLATMAIALFNGLGTDHIVDPEGITQATLDAILDFMYATIGADAEGSPPSGEGSR
jgi:AcrR family transcriptional regulator